MISPNTTNEDIKCGRCQTIVAGYEDSFSCMYCHESYCPFCLGYVKYFDMEELDLMIKDVMPKNQSPYTSTGYKKSFSK